MHLASNHYKSMILYCPIWQVSYDKTRSNGSTHFAEGQTADNKWWMDMNIVLQEACEHLLESSSSRIEVEFNGIQYVMDIESMTQLNTYNGSLRRIRRLLMPY